ncbi:hypothetical protein [Oryza sativa Japonica Group]|uniref:Os01g0351251 protein n=2 Tax=Oryza sativa subsp. japonica TaxID=39947 RepID=Q5ZC08_ORYSJ|nr:hypothetical protein [Oryza sativa Japonica Group]BAD53856.1 hypothetical protein [Oryza sativa Japonica Group]BAS72034.1 Os01g0351251 [Oryza sativa Japonica Group]
MGQSFEEAVVVGRVVVAVWVVAACCRASSEAVAARVRACDRVRRRGGCRRLRLRRLCGRVGRGAVPTCICVDHGRAVASREVFAASRSRAAYGVSIDCGAATRVVVASYSRTAHGVSFSRGCATQVAPASHGHAAHEAIAACGFVACIAGVRTSSPILDPLER